MAVLFDYLDWRGDLSFSVDPPNELDYYLISKIGCPTLTGLVSSDAREVALPDVVDAYQNRKDDDTVSLGVATSPLVLESFLRLPSVPRFRPLLLSGYRRTDNDKKTEQFSALTVRIPDGPRFVTFRGTDDNIFAWKENFHMAVMSAVPAQKDALRYLQWAMEAYDGDVIVVAHSKGGNLATYAASMLPEELQERIISVYNFDGPGFKDDFLQEEGYLRILPKLHFLIPQNSLIGLLLSTRKEPEIISCSTFGAKGHDGFTWDVLGTRFVRAASLSASSMRFKKAMDETLSKMSQNDRDTFIDDFFQIMTSTGAYTLTDLTETKLRNALKIARSLGRDKEVNKFALSMITNSLADFRKEKETEREKSTDSGN